MVYHSSVQIPEHIFTNQKFLKLLSKTKSERKLKKILKGATAEQLLSLAEICLNIVTSRFPLTTRQKKRLLPYADFVRRIGRIKTERGARKFIVQKGTGAGTSFFTALLTPILIELVKKQFGKNGKQTSSPA